MFCSVIMTVNIGDINEAVIDTAFSFFRHFSIIDLFFYEMTEKFYVISDQMSEKYLAAYYAYTI